MGDPEIGSISSFLERASVAYTQFVDRNLQRLMRIGASGMMLIHIVRRPTWTYLPDHRDNYSDLKEYPGWGISKLDSTTSYTLDIIFCALALHAILRTLRISELSETRDRALRYVTVPLCVVKIIECVVQIPLALANKPRMFVASPIEAIILFTSEPSFEGSLFTTMYRSLPYYFGLISILVCVIVSWSTLGLIIISNDPANPDPSFRSLGQSVWTMLNVLNTANWPSPIITSYRRNSGYFFFFLFYSVIVDWGFLNLILGLIVAFFEHSWEKNLDKERQKVNRIQRQSAVDAGSLQELHAISNINNYSSSSDVEQVKVVFNPMKAMSKKLPDDEISEGGETDEKGGRGIASDDFNRKESFDEVHSKHPPPNKNIEKNVETNISTTTVSFIRELVRTAVNSKPFSIIMDMILLIVACTFIYTPHPRTVITLQISLNVVELIFRLLFLPIGMTHAEWIKQPRNLSNLAYIMCLVSSSFIYLVIVCHDQDEGDCSPSHLNKSINWRMDGVVLFFIMVIRATILIRCTFVLRNVSWDVMPSWVQQELSRSGAIVNETFKGFMHLVLMLFIIIYLFACTGQMIFGGQLSKDPHLPDYYKLMESPYAKLGYWPLNFNDMPSSMVSMFTLLYVNNMYVLASGCAAVSSQWSEIFFATYYLLGVLYLRNIFTSFLWSRIGKILDRSYMPIETEEEEVRTDFFTKLTNVFKMTMSRYDKMCHNQESQPKAKSRAVDSMIHAEMSLIESTGVLLQYSRLGEAHTLFTKRTSLLAFRLRYKYVYPLLGCCWLLTFLRVFQKPYWLIAHPIGEDGLDKYFLQNSSYLHPAIHAAFKVPLFSVIIVALFAELIYKADGIKRVREAHVSVVFRYSLITLSLLSVSCSIGSGFGNLTCQKIDWMLSFCSVYYNLWFDRHALKRLIILVGVIPTLSVLVAILMVFIVFMAGFSYFVFDTSNLDHDDDHNNLYFSNYHDAVWHTLMAITSSSFPSQFMPVYRAYREYAFYFVPLIMIGGFLFLEGSIAVVNTAYRTRSDALQAALEKNRESVMTSAFDALRHETGVRIVEEIIVAKTIENETETISRTKTQAEASLHKDDSGDEASDDNVENEVQGTRNAEKTNGGDVELASIEADKIVRTRRKSAFEVSGLSTIDGRGKGFYNSSHKGQSLTKDKRLENMSSGRSSLVERLTSGSERISMHIVKDVPVSELKNVRAEACVRYDEDKQEISSIVSTHYVHGSVLDDLFTEVFANYNDFFKFNITRMMLGRGRYKSSRANDVTAIMRNILDIDNDGQINSADFKYLLFICRLKFARIGEHEMDFLEKQKARREKRNQIQHHTGTATWYESIYYHLWFLRRFLFSNINSLLKKVFILKDMKKNHWEALTDSIAGILSIGCCLSWRSSNVSIKTHQVFLDTFFALITVEVFLKMLFMSYYHYWSEMRNKVDFAVWLSFLLLLIIASAGSSSKNELSEFSFTSGSKFEYNVAYARELVVVIRLLLFPRNVTLMANPVNGVAWESVLTTIGALTFAFAEGFISFYFTYSQLGVLIFGGTMTRPGYNEELDSSRFGMENYYILNFNDMVAAFSTLFCALRVSDFDVITEGFSIVTSKAARIYFAAWYVFGVLLFFNVLKSYFISVFQPKESSSQTKQVRGDSVSPQPAMGGEKRRNSLLTGDEIPNTASSGKSEDEDGAGDDEYLSAEDISLDELEARNLNGEIIIDYYDILTNSNYVDGKAELENEAYRASGLARQAELPTRRKCKFVVSLPFKVSMDPDEREVVLRRLYFLSLNELKRKVERRANSFYMDTEAGKESNKKPPQSA